MKEIDIGPQGHSSASWICAALVRIGTRMATHFDQNLAEFGITQAQFRVLRAIQMADAASITPSALAEHLMIERATISVMTNRMVERGLLARLTGENRRTFNLAVTEVGSALLLQLLPTSLALAADILQELDEAHLSELRSMLVLVEQSLSTAEKPKQPLRNISQ
jgi:DNA-binding MarR family transcriptional regulator